MLKIKDNVQLKELEKFGFKKDEELSNDYETIFSIHQRYQRLCIDINSRTIFLYEMFNSNAFFIKCNVLVDLIEADIVEKVEGKNDC